MPIRFPCASCGKILSVPEAHAGRRGSCRACGVTLIVPELEAPDEDAGYALADPLPEEPELISQPAFAEPETTFHRAGRSAPDRPRRTTSHRQQIEEWKTLASRVSLSLLILTVVLGLAAAILPKGPMIVGGLLAAVGVGIYAYGSLTALYIAYTEDLLYAVLCVLFPPFALWYVVTRMEDLWHRLAIMAAGIAVLVVAVWFLRMALPEDPSGSSGEVVRIERPGWLEITSGGTFGIIRA